MATPQNESRLDDAGLAALLSSGSGWARVDDALTKTFTFKGFKRAVAFVNSVAEAANAANHHPLIGAAGSLQMRSGMIDGKLECLRNSS